MSNEKCEKGWRVIISVVIMVALVASIFVHFDCHLGEPDNNQKMQIINKINQQYLQVKKDIINSYNNNIKQALNDKQKVSVSDFISESGNLIDYNKKIFNAMTNNKNDQISENYKNFHVKKLLDFQHELVEKIQKINNSPKISFNNVKMDLNVTNENNILKHDWQTQIVEPWRKSNRATGDLILVFIRCVLAFIAVAVLPCKTKKE